MELVRKELGELAYLQQISAANQLTDESPTDQRIPAADSSSQRDAVRVSQLSSIRLTCLSVSSLSLHIQELCAELDECIRCAEEEYPDQHRWAARAADALRALAAHPRGEAAAAQRLRAWGARDEGAFALLLPLAAVRLSAMAVREDEAAAAALAWIVGLD